MRRPGNEMENFHIERNERPPDSEGYRLERDQLNKRMKKLVRAVRKDYRSKNDDPYNVEKFEAVVGELGRASF